MRKKIYLTFDVETIVSGVSKSDNYLSSVLLGAIFIADELHKRNLKGTFFISLSTKMSSIKNSDYLSSISCLLRILKSYENIKVSPHIHAYGLQADFECKSDDFAKYNLYQQIELLNYSKIFFANHGFEVDSFRPGGFRANDSYYEALNKSGYNYSSTLIPDKKENYNFLTGKIHENSPYNAKFDIIEYPVTSVVIKSIKNKIERLNLSPDFFTIESVVPLFEKLDYININFHSFSIYINRLVRENHDRQFINNLKFILIEVPINKIARKFNISTNSMSTIPGRNLIKWLDYIDKSNMETYFVGE